MATRQFTGKTVDEATDLALETLRLNREEVEIVVVNPGRSGILGFGGESAEIHVTPLVDLDDDEDEAEYAPADEGAGERGSRSRRPGRRGRGRGRGRPGQRESDDDREERVATVTAEESEKPDDTAPEDQIEAGAPPEEPDEPESEYRAGDDYEEEDSDEEPDEETERQPGPDPEVEGVATEVLDYFLSVMDVEVTTFVREDSEDADVAFEIEGEDAGLLIGRRGETLQALQFLVNMTINKKMERSAYVTIDVEGYRERRRDSLRSTAERAAERVVRSGKPQTLQPMSAADRRIIHLALLDHPDVRTESRGEGEQRRVVVMQRD